MNLAFVSTSATTVEGNPHEFAGRTVEVLGHAAYARNRSECRLLGDTSGDIAYVRDCYLHRFNVRRDVNGFVVQQIRPDILLTVEDWLDLADAYVQACLELGRQPLIVDAAPAEQNAGPINIRTSGIAQGNY